jgi:FKBP-type peptidyl-prolyl cis-trans isomerase
VNCYLGESSFRKASAVIGLLAWVGLIISLPASAGDSGNEEGQGSPSGPTLSKPGPFAAPPDVREPPAEALRTASGIAMTILHSGSESQHPEGDDCVVVKFTTWKRDGSLLATSGAHGESAVQCLITAIPGVSEVLKLMVPGERRRIWVPAELAFTMEAAHHHQAKGVHPEPQPEIDLTFDIELIRILRAPSKPLDLAAPPATAQRMPSGVVIEVLNPGTGTTHPKMESRVTLNYSGWGPDGTLLESTVISGHAAAVLVGTALAGWREVLPLMVTGEKVRAWIPAARAFGEGTFRVTAPAGNLVYDIELEGIE